MQIKEQKKIIYGDEDYGIVLRSSAIFYYKKSPIFKTTISLLNYWKLKREIDVAIIASLRRMDGSLVKREKLDFNNGMVINYSPQIQDKYFEGSVELEAFSIENLVIPYAGIIVIYETINGVSMVHSYSRIYSQHEVETGQTITDVEECCLPIKNSADIESFAVFHNGDIIVPAQKVFFSILNHKGTRKNFSFELKILQPYETVKINFQDHFPKLVEFLEHKTGYCTISFKLNRSFTRMAIINKKIDDSDFQIAHSDFNYGKYFTDKLEEGKLGHMSVPKLSGTIEYAIVYPDCDIGNYEIKSNGKTIAKFNENKHAEIPITGSDSEVFLFKKIDAPLPTRIHTGLRILKSIKRIPSEPCLGIYHDGISPKRFYWGVCVGRKNWKSRIILQQYVGFNDPKKEENVVIKLYSDHAHESREIKIEPTKLRNGVFLSELFPDADEFLLEKFGWFTLFSPYPYCMIYSTMENTREGITLEHTI